MNRREGFYRATRHFYQLWLFLLPLVFWPDLEQPFSTAKLLWIVFGAVFSIVFLALFPGKMLPALSGGCFWGVICLSAIFSISSLISPAPSLEEMVLRFSAIPAFFVFQSFREERDWWMPALLWSSLVLSLVVWLQWIGCDPFRWIGLRAESFAGSRMRLYGTFGNPNFTAVWLAAILPVFASIGTLPGKQYGLPQAWRRWLWIIPLGALLLTGSRTFLLALPFFGLSFVGIDRWKKSSILSGLAIGFLLLSSHLGARSWSNVLEGRWYTDSLILDRLGEIPWLGYGPGAFSGQFSLWQEEYRHGPTWNPAHKPYIAVFDHAHNDYLEFWVDYGLAGFLALIVFFSLILWQWARKKRTVETEYPFPRAVGMGIAFLLTVSFIDFPLHRPAEWQLLWILMALAV